MKVLQEKKQKTVTWAKDVKFNVKDKFSRKRKLKKYAKKLAKAIFRCCSNKNVKDYENLVQEVDNYGKNDNSFKEDVFKKVFNDKYSDAIFDLILATDTNTFNGVMKGVSVKILDYLIDEKKELIDNMILMGSVKVLGKTVINLENVVTLNKLIVSKSNANNKKVVCQEIKKFINQLDCTSGRKYNVSEKRM